MYVSRRREVDLSGCGGLYIVGAYSVSTLANSS